MRKGLLGRASGAKIFKWCFFGYRIENVTFSFQGLWLLCLVSEKIPRRPSEPSQKQDFLGPHAVSLAYKWVDWKKKCWLFDVFWRFVQKEFFLEIFGRAVSNWGIQTSRVRDKNPERKHVTVFEFLQRPKVGSTIDSPKKNIKKEFSLCFLLELLRQRQHVTGTFRYANLPDRNCILHQFPCCFLLFRWECGFLVLMRTLPWTILGCERSNLDLSQRSLALFVGSRWFPWWRGMHIRLENFVHGHGLVSLDAMPWTLHGRGKRRGLRQRPWQWMCTKPTAEFTSLILHMTCCGLENQKYRKKNKKKNTFLNMQNLTFGSLNSSHISLLKYWNWFFEIFMFLYFWIFEIQKFWNFEFEIFWNFLKFWNFKNFEFLNVWVHEILHFWHFAFLKFFNYWNFWITEIFEILKFEIWNFLKFLKFFEIFEILKF